MLTESLGCLHLSRFCIFHPGWSSSVPTFIVWAPHVLGAQLWSLEAEARAALAQGLTAGPLVVEAQAPCHVSLWALVSYNLPVPLVVSVK